MGSPQASFLNKIDCKTVGFFCLKIAGFCKVRSESRKRDTRLAQSARAHLMALARVLLRENAGWFSLCITNVNKMFLRDSWRTRH